MWYDGGALPLSRAAENNFPIEVIREIRFRRSLGARRSTEYILYRVRR
jgi:hypothetical protein